jgi:hypothetical protein
MMQFNVDKCKTVHAGYKNPRHKYTLGGRELGEVEEERDLGVIIHKSMSVSRQCCEAAKKANRAVGQIKRTVTERSKEVIVPLYKSLVRPQLEYCVEAWRPYLKKDISVLEKVQRRATKMIEGMHDLTYEERLRACKLPSLEERGDRGDLIETFKIVKGIDKVPSAKFFTPAAVQRRGHTAKLFKERSRLELRKNFFSQRVVNNWNALPQAAISAETINQFKNRHDRQKKGV